MDDKPYEDEWSDEDDCDCDDCDEDILTGRFDCNRCGRSWCDY